MPSGSECSAAGRRAGDHFSLKALALQLGVLDFLELLHRKAGGLCCLGPNGPVRSDGTAQFPHVAVGDIVPTGQHINDGLIAFQALLGCLGVLKACVKLALELLGVSVLVLAPDHLLELCLNLFRGFLCFLPGVGRACIVIARVGGVLVGNGLGPVLTGRCIRAAITSSSRTRGAAAIKKAQVCGVVKRVNHICAPFRRITAPVRPFPRPGRRVARRCRSASTAGPVG